jgi:hypothetical protein
LLADLGRALWLLWTREKATSRMLLEPSGWWMLQLRQGSIEENKKSRRYSIGVEE